MKKSLLFLSLVFFLGISVNATDYYLASNGSDGNNGTSQFSPWRTIDKLNSYSSNFRSGDRILFRRGDTFYGGLNTSDAGRLGNPVIYEAYGAGNKPIISGFTEVNSWNSLGGNIWESTTSVSNLPNLNVVIINGINTPMGRYPNAESSYPFHPNFIPFQARSGSGMGYTSLTSSDLNGGTNWKGAEVVVRTTQWLLDREIIVNQSGNTISYYGKATDFHGNGGFGFFIQNDPRTLDVQNEWYYNPTSKKIRIYSKSYPSNVQVSSIDTIINSNHNYSYKIFTVFNDISIQGANTTGISFNGNGGKTVPTISNCEVSFVGDIAISLSGLSDAVVENNLITNSGGSAIWHSNGSNITIRGNTIRNAGVISNYKANDYNGSAISLTSPNSLVQYNNIDSSAYCGIKFGGSYVQIRNNFINHSNLTRGDGGGIYTAYANEPGKIIDGNIIVNSIGNPRGTPNNAYYAFGIYIDELGHDMTISNNTVANCSASGFFLHDTKSITANNNTIYNNGSPGWSNSNMFIQGDAGGFSGVMRGHNFTNNIFFAKNKEQYSFKYYSEDNSNAVWTFGNLDNNYYAKPMEPSTAIQSWQSSNVITTMSLDQWKPFSGKDGNTKEVSKTVSDESELRFEFNATKQSKIISLDANYVDVKGNSYDGSITLAPYTSAVLMRNGAVQNQPSTPVANAGSDQTITLPANSVTLSGSGSVKNGSIVSYNWTKKSGPTSGKIVSSNSASTSVTDLVEGTYVFELKVVDNNGASITASVQITVQPVQPSGNLLPSLNPSNTVNGIDYKYYEGSNYSLMPDFSKITPLKTGTKANLDLSMANRAEQFAINFTGYIDVPKDGQYTFYTSSDDGSKLYIDDILIVNNDGLHSWEEKAGQIGLKAGKHMISIGFFQGTGDKGLEASYAGPGVSKQLIPSSALYRISNVSVEDLSSAVYATNLVNGIDYKYFEGSYTSMPLFSSLVPVKTGSVSNFDLSVANRSESFAINYTGFIEVPTDGIYTFYTGSDDGSMLWIDNKLIVDNDGLHGWEEKSNTIGLKAGKHFISVEFFQATGGKALDVYYSGPGISKRLIPSSALYIYQTAYSKESNGFGSEALASTKPLKQETLYNSPTIKISAYPNPFVNSITVTLNGEAGDYKLQMMDALGRTLWTRSGSKNAGIYQQSLNSSTLQKGIYFLKVIQNDNSSVIKLLK